MFGCIEYELGEEKRQLPESEELNKLIAKEKLPNIPELFGWGDYYVTNEPLINLMIKSIKKTLDHANVSSKKITHVLICGSNLFLEAAANHCANHDNEIGLDSLGFAHSIISKFELTNAFPLGLSFSSCTSLLASMDLASKLIASGSDSILLVYGDKIKDEDNRISSYAVFSDCATSMIFSNELTTGYKVLASESGIAFDQLSGESGLQEINAERALFADVHSRLLNKLENLSPDFCAAFSNNIYLPVQSIKEGYSGYDIELLYTEQVAKTGHCFSADPVIGLSDFRRANSQVSGEQYLLTSYGSALRFEMAIERV